MTQHPQTQWATAHPVSVGWMRQFRYFLHLYERIREVPGDIVECGVGEGNTFAILAYLAGSEGKGRRLTGFDSFQGFPEPSSYDDSPRHPQKGEWKVEEVLVRRRLEESGISSQYPELATTLVPGFLGGALPGFAATNANIAFLHLDVDLYEGYRDGLAILYERVSPGGVIAFDEYREFRPNDPAYGVQEKWPGCTRAVDEFLQRNPERLQYWPETKKYFIVKGQ